MKKITFVAALIAVIVFGIVAYSFAAPSTDTETVAVTAMANPKLTLTVSTSTVDFVGDPGVATGTKPVVVTVQSNKDYTLTKTVTNGALYTVNTDLASPSAGSKGAADAHTDNVGVTISWSADPDIALSGGSILYSATTN